MFGRFAAILVTLVVAGCATTTTPGVVTDLPQTPYPEASGSATPPVGPQKTGIRTVLSPLGLNIRSSASTSGTKLAAAAQGAELKVLDYTAANGGWFNVEGATVSGWITADPSLTAQGSFTPYGSSEKGFAVLYPTSWTFADEPKDVIFRPQSGTTTVVVRVAASTAALGAAGASGYTQASDDAVVVCGVTGDLIKYDHSGTGSASPIAATAPLQSHLAQIRLKLDATHAIALDLNYESGGAVDDFAHIYDSMTFNVPACQAPASPAPTP